MIKYAVIAVLVLGITLGGWVLLNDSESTNTPISSSTTNEGSPTQKSSNDTTGTTEQPGGQYIDYSQSSFAAASGDRLLFFHAPWCPQCRQLENDIKNSTVPNGVTIFKVDYDSNQDLRKKYGVTIQTTVVKVDKNGDLVKKYVAYDDPTLENVKTNLL